MPPAQACPPQRSGRRGHGGRQPLPGCAAGGSGSPAPGRCWRCWWCRRCCRCDWCGRTPRSRTRRCTCGRGHLEWAHWLHGVPHPAVPGVLLRGPGDLPAAGRAGRQRRRAGRGPGAVAGLHARGDRAAVGPTARLFGRRAAFFAAALFAVLGPTLHLGAFATYDAMSLFLVALAAWCVVRAGDRADATGWMVAAGVALALANAAAYSTALFDPVVVVARGPGRLAGRGRRPPPGGRDGADRDRRAADRGAADRRRHLPRRDSSRPPWTGSPAPTPPLSCWPTPGPGPA